MNVAGVWSFLSLILNDNRLRLSASINVVKWLTFQKCAFRGNDESVESKNQGIFLVMLKLIASYNKDVQAVVLANAPQNAKYTALSIKKQNLHVFAKNVQNEIWKDNILTTYKLRRRRVSPTYKLGGSILKPIGDRRSNS